MFLFRGRYKKGINLAKKKPGEMIIIFRLNLPRIKTKVPIFVFDERGKQKQQQKEQQKKGHKS